METLYPSILTLHILSFAAFSGATFIDYLLFLQLWKAYPADISKAKTIWQIKSKLFPVIRFGGAVAFLAGIGLMVFMHQIYGEQMWMRIKFPLVILAIINIIVLAVRQRKIIGTDLENNILFNSSTHSKIKSNFNFFYIIELLLLFAIILLSAFRFN